MRTILKLNFSNIWVECTYDDKADTNPFRLYKLYWAEGRDGYNTKHRKLVDKYSNLRSVLQQITEGHI